MKLNEFRVEITNGGEFYTEVVERELLTQSVHFQELLNIHVIYDFKVDDVWITVRRIDIANKILSIMLNRDR